MPRFTPGLTHKAPGRPQMTHFACKPHADPPELFAQQTAIVWEINGARWGWGGGQRGLLTNKGGNPVPSIQQVPLDLAMTLLLTFPAGQMDMEGGRGLIHSQVAEQKEGHTEMLVALGMLQSPKTVFQPGENGMKDTVMGHVWPHCPVTSLWRIIES